MGLLSNTVDVKSLCAGAAAVLLLFVTGSHVTRAQAGADHKRLESFAGRWRLEIDITGTGAAPGAKLTGTDSCEWFANMHMVCTTDTGAYRSLRALSYVPAMKQYALYSVDSNGTAGLAMGQVQGNSWTFANDVGGVKYRSVINVSKDGYSSKTEYAGAGGKWVAVSESKATRQ